MAMNVTVYSTPTCPYCTRAKDYLKQHNVAFESIDVSQNQEKAQKMVDISGQMGVPVIDVDGEIIVGFDQEKLKQALKI